MALVLDGKTLTIETLAAAARDPRLPVEVSAEALARVRACRDLVDRAVQNYLAAGTEEERRQRAVYGVTTGFGEFKSILVEKSQLRQLQKNVLLSHCVGMGDNENEDDPANYFPAAVVRAAIILRINTFLKGHSGVRVELVERLLQMVNRGIVPLVPTRGSLGSSGDLCPLAHTFVTLLGEGHYYTVRTPEEVERGLLGTAKQSAKDHGTFEIAEKEGLALTNGAVYTAAMLALAVLDAENLADTADAAAALALEAIQGAPQAFDEAVHQSRGFAGQMQSARNIRELVKGSQFVGRRQDVQDAYSVRCAPQVHGASRDAIAYCRKVAETELNAATDNPLFFADRPGVSFSAGNFHGQPLGLAADFLAIAVAELANISERRTQMLLDKNHNGGLPANLIADGGLNTGLMIAQYTAASLVSENKVYCHPASVDSIPSSSNIEDHVAMATTAARKLGRVLANTKGVLAIELMVGAQAVEWRWMENQPDGRDFKREFVAEPKPGQQALRTCLGQETKAAYEIIRNAIAPMTIDNVLEPSFRIMRRLVDQGLIAALCELFHW